MNIVSTTRLNEEIRESLIKKYDDVTFRFFENIEEADSSLEEAEILITFGEDLTEQTIDRMKCLKWIMVISAGLDLMPFEAIDQKGILVTNAKGIHASPMAEYTIAMMLQVSRKTKQLIEHEKKGVWDRSVKMDELNGRTLGILGTGAIGTQIAKYAKVFNMKTIGLNRSGRAVDHFDETVNDERIEELLTKSDYIVSVLPSTKDTDGMINKQLFDQMKQDAIFINIGRGKSVNEADLIETLQEGKLAHAVLDVFVQEPLPKDHPFWKMENVTVTPHLSGISPQYFPRAIEIFEKNLITYQTGGLDYLNEIDVKKGY